MTAAGIEPSYLQKNLQSREWNVMTHECRRHERDQCHCKTVSISHCIQGYNYILYLEQSAGVKRNLLHGAFTTVCESFHKNDRFL